MIPTIRCGLTEDGQIEAALCHPWRQLKHVVVDRRTGELLASTVKQGTNEFRWLILAARKHVSRG